MREEKLQANFLSRNARLFLTLLILFSVLVLGLFGRLAYTITSTLKQAAKVEVSSSTNISIYSVANSLQRQSKLVVQTALVTVDQSMEKESVLSMGGFAFGLGTSSLRMISMGNRVQYYVPLKDITESDINWNSENKTLLIRVPPPIADSEMVEIQTDPKQILFLGKDSWFDWARGGGKTELAQEAKDNLRNYVLRTARSRYYMSLAEENAQRELERLLCTILYPIEPQCRIVIEFKSPK
ncbi:MAG TPA: DUF4230 domain-containing protein [Verrucomicrobiota bacterium]|jgi:hypothetical protein|nr:DUF4230 domain-containing protein [Verrucomicrobiota bacterium]